MKRILGILLAVIFTCGLFAQQPAKPDVILKLNGDELSGKVTEITDNEVKFTYAGETLVYPIKKIDILKITYGSGRVEFFNKQPLPSEAKSEPATAAAVQKNTADHAGKVGVLPFAFVKDGQSTVDALSDKVQNETYNYLVSHGGSYTIVDPRTTNAVLIKAGINKDNIKGYTMVDICNVLGVEYVVDGIVTVNRSTQTIRQSNQGTTNTDYNNKSGSKEKTTNSSTFATAEQEYETSLNLNIYNDKGTSVYNKERKSLLSTQGAYKSTLEYLLKRSPLYVK